MKVLITVKTYPTLSKKYSELVCTAGLTEEGNWIRVYPIRYRNLDYTSQYKKYDWVDIDLIRNRLDFRPESHRPLRDDTQPTFLEHIDTQKGSWEKRKNIVLKNVHTDMTRLVNSARQKGLWTSLATFKPTKVIGFDYKPTDREWQREKLQIMKQMNLFEQTGKSLTPIRKVPYKFRYEFKDENGRHSQMMIEDWETGALYWNCLQRADGNEQVACQQVAQKYFDDFAQTKDLHFFLGTTQAHHNRARNPFMIIGTFTPPFVKPPLQLSLFAI